MRGLARFNSECKEMSSQTKIILTLVLWLALNFKVSAAAQQYEAKTLEGGCPEIDTNQNVQEVKSELLQVIRPLIEQVSETVSSTTKQSTESPTTMGQTTKQSTKLPTTMGQTTEQSTESPTTMGQTTEQSQSTTAEPLYTCNGTLGWRRVVFINMTDTSYNCPPGLNLTSYSKRTCGRAHTGTNSEDRCSSTTFSVGGSEYSRVCGRIRGYQIGGTDGFYGFLISSQFIDGFYVDGVSLTHGPVGGRTHIWTFAAGFTDLNNFRYPFHQCPCATSNSRVHAPQFIGNDYFCESGIEVGDARTMLFSEDPLWDGQGCASTSTCCQRYNSPWFTKTLTSTTDDIEFRLCVRDSYPLTDVGIELIELYVQ